MSDRVSSLPVLLRVIVLLASIGMTATQTLGDGFPIAEPSEVGLSDAGLKRLSEYLQTEVDQGRIAGAVGLIARHGRLAFLESFGHADLESDKPMKADALFRIASMTKAITSAGVMSLVEDGRLSLEDPLSKHLPEFGGLRVLQNPDGDSLATVACARQPTIHDLMTHRSGMTNGWFGPEKLDEVYGKNNLNRWFVPTEQTLAERVASISKAPLKFQPGSSWDYSVSLDVLGRVIEVASGLPLDDFLYERFFRPLGMNDTSFVVPHDRQTRLASLYTTDEAEHLVRVDSKPISKGFLNFSGDYCLHESQMPSGGGGLVSTATDYLRFLQMLLNGGVLDGVRVLRHDSVAAMTSNQIDEMVIPFPGHGDGFGFGFGVKTDRGNSTAEFSVGSYSWGGIFNTYFWVDPQEQVVAILMTQLFPYDHLDLRDQFRRLAYESIDDSGFQKVYWYTPGDQHGNPHFNARQLRVNASGASIHPKFASRSEPRSSGMARIKIEEDLRKIRRADLSLEVWGGHPGTENKQVSVNGRKRLSFPHVGTEAHHCTHQYPQFNLRRQDLVNGYNSLQFSCDQGETFWGHYIVDQAAIKIGLHRDDERLRDLGMTEFSAEVVATPLESGEGFSIMLAHQGIDASKIQRVDYQARYRGYDENGNRLQTDWHGMTKGREPYATLSESSEAPFATVWNTSMLPQQHDAQIRAVVRYKDANDLIFTTRPVKGLQIAHSDEESVSLFTSVDLPTPFWSRAGKERRCTIPVDLDPSSIEKAELHVVAWTGGAGDVSDYFTLNGQHLPIAEGSGHETIYSRISIDPKTLKRGDNEIRLLSDTEHHGIEILAPGPALMLRYRNPDVAADHSGLEAETDNFEDHKDPKIRLSHSADPSAGGLECYKIETANATYYLDKTGAGLSSMIDQDGNDWLGFHPETGSGAAGEYRGFPNAVFKEAGSYFHATNSGTDPCTTTIIEHTPTRLVISAESDNGLWAANYTFTDSQCTFTMTKMPEGRGYWVLYEGVPGGQYDDSDWWMTSQQAKKTSLTSPHEIDIAGPEWIAFGDRKLNRSLVLHHDQDDQETDRFYQMQSKMTVFGFGRDGMQKLLRSVPQSFSIRFIESTDHATIGQQFVTQTGEVDSATQRPKRKTAKELADLENFALTHRGDAAAGQTLFNDERTKCLICHRVGKQGGDAGPDLSMIGNKFDRPHLVESLLYPSKQISYGYETHAILTVDGQLYSGIIKERSEKKLTVVDANNRRQEILTNDIDEQTVSKSSFMPEGLADTLSAQEFTNLIAYLESLRSGKAKMGSGVAGPIGLPDGFVMKTVATGLSGAVAMDVAPDGRVFVCEQAGTLRVIENDSLLEEPFVSLPVEMNWERGLIGVTVAPDFPSDPHVYVVYVTDKPFTHHRVSRFRAEGNLAQQNSESILLRGDDQSKFGGNVPAGHQGGAIHFGTDGKLYVGIGEQTAKTPSQRFDALQGKILRINSDGSIPSDNPFLERTSGKYQSIWAIGCRNPFTFAFNRSTGAMLINDVGGKFEEINPGEPGANYGWPKIEHGPTDKPGITNPIHIYPQSSINGGDFSDGIKGWPDAYRNRYFFADFVHGWIKTIDPENPTESKTFASGIRRPVDLRFAPDGSLYVLLRNAWVVDDKFQGGTGSLLKISYVGTNE